MAKSRAGHNPRLRVEDAVKALTYVIGVMGALSVSRYIGPAYALGFFSLFLLSALFEYRRVFPVPRWLLTLATLLFVVVSFLRMSLQNFVQPAVEALIILFAIKFLEEKKFRDYMQIYALSVFLLAGASLLSLDILFLAYFFALLFLLAAGMVLLAYYAEDSAMELPFATVRSITLKTLFIPLASIPLAAILFVILPRTQYPVFNILNRGGGASTGFSDTVGLGQVSAIQEDTTVIMRVGMEKVDDASLYWRGIILDYFDGRSWKSSGREQSAGTLPVMRGRRIAQTIYLDPYGNRYLFALDKPLEIRAQHVRRISDLTYALTVAIDRKLKYEAISVLSDALPEDAKDNDRYLQTPRKGVEKIRELAQGLAKGGMKEEKAAAILQFLRNGEFQYSLNKLPLSDAPLDDFLFQHKYGNCEYFASAMAILLRFSGIPSRLVGGYRGGFYSEAGGYYMIPQRNAHVWVEAYFEHKGWVRLDPTPAPPESYVSPSRRSLLFRLSFFFDAVNYYWNAAVINYDLERQFSLMNKLREGFRDRRFGASLDRKRASTFLLILLGAGSLGLAWYVLKGTRKASETKLLAAFLGKMKRRGYVKARPQGLEEFVATVKEDELRQRARHFVELFEGHFYRDRRLTRDDARRLKRMLDDL